MVKRQSECVEMWPESFQVWPAPAVFAVWGWNAGHVASASRATDARMSHPPSRAPFHGLLCSIMDDGSHYSTKHICMACL